MQKLPYKTGWKIVSITLTAPNGPMNIPNKMTNQGVVRQRFVPPVIPVLAGRQCGQQLVVRFSVQPFRMSRPRVTQSSHEDERASRELSGGVMALVVIIAGVLATLSVVTLFIFQRKHPGNLGSPRTDRNDRTRGRERVQRRPAGPDAENMSADRPGGFVPPGPPPR